MLELTDKHFLGKGLNRSVYLHPENKKWCIKILHDKNPWEKSENEVRYLKKVQRWKRGVKKVHPRYIGVVETNFGRGRVFKLIRDKGTQKISLNLEDYVAQQMLNEAKIVELERALEKMIARMHRARLVARDVHAKNICVKQLKSGIRMMLIDGIGHNAFLPFLDWVSFLRTKHHNKHLKKIRDYIKNLREQL